MLPRHPDGGFRIVSQDDELGRRKIARKLEGKPRRSGLASGITKSHFFQFAATNTSHKISTTSSCGAATRIPLILPVEIPERLKVLPGRGRSVRQILDGNRSFFQMCEKNGHSFSGLIYAFELT